MKLVGSSSPSPFISPQSDPLSVSKKAPIISQKAKNLQETLSNAAAKGRIGAAGGSVKSIEKADNAKKKIPNRFTAQGVAQRLVKRHGNAGNVEESIERIFSSDPRFNGQDERYVVPPGLKNDLLTELHRLGRSGTKKAKDAGSKAFPTEMVTPSMRKLDSHIATSLVGLVDRKPLSKPMVRSDGDLLMSSEGNPLKLHQQQGHMEGSKWVNGLSISAEVQKLESTVQEIANHGYVAIGETEVPQRIVIGRSARTDTKQKVEEKSLADITARLASTSKNGLELVIGPGGEQHYAYQRVDVTLMDASPIKSMATTLKTGLSSIISTIKGQPSVPIEDERKFISNKKHAIKDLWDPAKNGINLKRDARGWYIERQVKDSRLQPHQVREYQPILLNYVFSSEAKTNKVSAIVGSNVRKARRDNMPGQIALLSRLNSRENLGLDGAIAAVQAKASKRNLKELVAAIDQQLKGEIPPHLKLQLESARIALSGRDSAGKKYDDEQGTGRQYLMTSLLSSSLDYPLTVECKSGNDRTATAMALTCAQEEFKARHTFDYDPTWGEESPHFEEFCTLFTDYIIAFGVPNVEVSRGVNEEGVAALKVGKSPVFKVFGRPELLVGKVEIT